MNRPRSGAGAGGSGNARGPDLTYRPLLEGTRIGRLLALAAGALLIGACASTTIGTAPTPTGQHVTPTSVVLGTLNPNEPTRWGHVTTRGTGRRDPPVSYAPLPVGYRIESYLTGLNQPVALAFLPDGRMLITEQDGRIMVVRNGRLLAEPYYQVDVYRRQSAEGVSEMGLIGVAVDPDFSSNHYVYTYYTVDRPRRTILARLREVSGRAILDKVIMTLDAAPVCCHVAGSLRFAPDGTLFVTIGDHQMEAEAQNRGSPYGAILHIDRDGNAIASNPFVNDPAADPRIYAYGLRNPFDVAYDAVNGRMFATENGFVGQDAIIDVKPGANYGWPGFELSLPLDQMALPLLFYNEAIGPAGIEFYRNDTLPALDGSLLFCQFHQGGALHQVTFHSDGGVDGDRILALGCTSDVLTGPDGFVYFLDYVDGVVYRIAAP